MLGRENTKKIDEVFDNHYMKIKECLSGLEEIFKMNFLEKNIYFQLGMDNVSNLQNNVLELLKYTYNPRQVRIKLREIRADGLEAKESILK
jgi:hypothetical protein